MSRLRDEHHAAERAQAHGLHVERLAHAARGDMKAGGLSISPCPVCGPGFDVIVHELAGGGVAARCNGCNDPAAIAAAMLATPEGGESFSLSVKTARELCELPHTSST